MASIFRPILPAEASAAGSQPRDESSGSSGRSRRNVVHRACIPCQKRKSKCDGSRPQCGSCQMRGTTCEFAAAQGKTRLGTLKEANQNLQTRLDKALDVFKKLQTLPNDEAERMFQRLRAGHSPKFLFDVEMSPVEKESGHSSSDVPTSPESPTEMDTLSELADGIEKPTRTHDWKDMSNGLRLAVPQASTFELAMASLFGSTGPMYRPYDPETANNLLKCLLENDPQVPEPVLCEICAISCLGCRFSQNAIPAELGELFYIAARNLLEIIIEDNPFPAMKVCSLLAIYCVINKPVVTSGLLEIGLAIGHSAGFNQERCPDGILHQEWSKYKRVWRTLVYFKSWLNVLFGFSYDTPFYPTDVAFRTLNETPGFDLEDRIQTQIARMSVLKTEFFQDISRNGLSVRTVQSFQSNLREWFTSLPPEVQLQSLVKENTDHEARRLVYFLHMIHLGSIITLFRRTMVFYNVNGDGLPENASSDLGLIAHSVGKEGLLAARQVSRMLHLLLTEDALLKKSWLCVFTSYMACVIAMRSAFQQILHGSQGAGEDMTAVEMAMTVLRSCAQRDYVGHQIYKFLKIYYDILQETRMYHLDPKSLFEDAKSPDAQFNVPMVDVQEPMTKVEDPLPHPSYPNDFAFDSPKEDSIAGKACRDLAKIMIQPFSSIPGVNLPQRPGLLVMSIEEICLGIHLDWSGEPLPLPRVGDTPPWPGLGAKMEIGKEL